MDYPRRKFYVGQRIIIDDFHIDRHMDKPDFFMPIPDFPNHNIIAESVPLRRNSSFTGSIVDCKDTFVNGMFSG